MSAAALKWFRKLQIEDRTLSLVLETLARMHFVGSPLFPSQQTMADRTKLSAKTVFSALKALQHFGLIYRRARFTAKEGRTSDEIVLRLDAPSLVVEKSAVRALRKQLAPPSQILRDPLVKFTKDKEFSTTTVSVPRRGHGRSNRALGAAKRPNLRLVVGGDS